MADYNWRDCHCRECEKMDLRDTNSSGDAYCTERHRYYNPNDRACSDKFKYDNQRNPSSGGGCYITTVIYTTMGTEDVDYLKILRDFREKYMKQDNNLLPILSEYDIIGPEIAHRLSIDPSIKTICNNLLTNYILKIVEYIKNDQKNSAILKYIEMVNSLKNFYRIESDKSITLDKNIITGKGYLLMNNKK